MSFFKRKPKPEPSILLHPQAGHAGRNPKDEFAEIYGTSLVNSRRMFVIACLAIFVALGASGALYSVAVSKVAVPWMYPVSETGGVMSKPVRLEPTTPSKAVLKAELGKWLEPVYTIDSKQTLQMFREANKRTSGKALEQFRDFRATEEVMRKIKEQPDFIRIVQVNSVDVSQDGIAFAYLTTKESGGTEAPANPKTYRVTLHYKIVPPDTEAKIMQNPLGLYVTFFNPTAERR